MAGDTNRLESGAATKMAPADDAPWRQFPQLDAALQAEEPPVLAKIEKTCRALAAILESGAPREKDRARAALAAYGRALELYHQLADLRDGALEQATNPGPPSIND